ncbi:hypothetical protein C499_07255 [Halogeometricum borinquense DSM 11551]|uniref:Uncharacterized protein n=2 Tax=Halogeometricum borinquense TaxID=60847 RepID=E4NVH7_HALBP|nr:hypothetical protein [Halogeometricum borinquense]ADQ68861.1 hypothetical protein Hbor_33370 [Halogeometricum borinquense DSM 11551]ELY28711.1 hypothetical protein C499_07255 [Halogeometricum borinquense DSM 11551]RYJ08422.1 hypothetical protein ELS19_17950 [Halogeometricum borinquense]
MSLELTTVVLKIGYAGQNEPVVGGALTFFVAAVGVLYLSFVRDEMETGPLMKVAGFLLLGMALLAYYWPMRPWPH